MIDLYTKPDCPFCEKTKQWLTAYAIPYREIDITQDAAIVAWLKAAGHKKVPQLYVGETLLLPGGYEGLASHTPEEIAEMVLELSRKGEDELSENRALLDVQMCENDAGAATVGEYLCALLSTLWVEQESFSGKRPFGNSDWQYDVQVSVIAAGMTTGTLDDNGDIDQPGNVDYVIQKAIRALYSLPQ